MKYPINPRVEYEPKARYMVYYPDDGRYSKLMTLREARALVKQFVTAYIVNSETAEVFG